MVCRIFCVWRYDVFADDSAAGFSRNGTGLVVAFESRGADGVPVRWKLVGPADVVRSNAMRDYRGRARPRLTLGSTAGDIHPVSEHRR